MCHRTPLAGSLRPTDGRLLIPCPRALIRRHKQQPVRGHCGSEVVVIGTESLEQIDGYIEFTGVSAVSARRL